MSQYYFQAKLKSLSRALIDNGIFKKKNLKLFYIGPHSSVGDHGVKFAR